MIEKNVWSDLNHEKNQWFKINDLNQMIYLNQTTLDVTSSRNHNECL